MMQDRRDFLKSMGIGSFVLFAQPGLKLNSKGHFESSFSDIYISKMSACKIHNSLKIYGRKEF